ncbi:MAG TPA: cupin domain-containing protein [Mycobacteriales bacterium]|nr:cupin domain-containing protein [Mycobacteriales bacterium]
MPLTSKATAQEQDFGLAIDRTAELEGYTVNIVTIQQTHSLKDMLAGLPGGQCHCPHWGYLLSGRMSVDYGDRSETYGPGDAFYMPAGHVPTADAGTEFVMFSPTEELKETEAAIQAHFQNA